jgi:hypothetical protein
VTRWRRGCIGIWLPRSECVSAGSSPLAHRLSTSLKELHRTFMLLGRCACLERAEIPSPSGFWIGSPRVEAVLPCVELADHDSPSPGKPCRTLATTATCSERTGKSAGTAYTTGRNGQRGRVRHPPHATRQEPRLLSRGSPSVPKASTKLQNTESEACLGLVIASASVSVMAESERRIRGRDRREAPLAGRRTTDPRPRCIFCGLTTEEQTRTLLADCSAVLAAYVRWRAVVYRDSQG